MFFMKYKKIFVFISSILVFGSIVLMFTLGLRLGIDFKGGAQLELTYPDGRPEVQPLVLAAKNAGFGDVLIQPSGESDFLIKTRDLSEEERAQFLEIASFDGSYQLEQKSFNSIGPSVGAELTRKAITALILVSLAIVFFIAYAFRKVSEPVSSWKYGLIAIITLLHDVIISIGVFTILSHFNGTEIDTLFVVALLTILGLSVSDTIVIFDRIRENLREKTNESFESLVGRSLDQTLTRSFNTSFTVILALVALVIFGPASTRTFAIMLTAGMFFGAYSSIFLASPLLVYALQWGKKK